MLILALAYREQSDASKDGPGDPCAIGIALARSILIEIAAKLVQEEKTPCANS